MVVAVTQRIDHIADRGELRDALDQRMVGWLLQAGFLPVAVPNTLLEPPGGPGTLQGWLEAVAPGALLLSGGNDLGEYPGRDATESMLLEWAAAHRVPVLGICRGAQMMGVWAGSELVPVTGHAGSRHGLAAAEDGGDWPDSVNSYHNWALGSCPEGFQVLARAQDGCLEAVGHVELPWQGWMWHPEREASFSAQDIKRVRGLFGAK